MLIVDDDRAVARVIANVVRELGYEPVITHGTDDAMSTLARGGAFHAVISDQNLGAGETGAALLARVRAAYPATRRVLMSGSEDDATQFGDVAHAVLVKPLEPDDLERLLG